MKEKVICYIVYSQSTCLTCTEFWLRSLALQQIWSIAVWSHGGPVSMVHCSHGNHAPPTPPCLSVPLGSLEVYPLPRVLDTKPRSPHLGQHIMYLGLGFSSADHVWGTAEMKKQLFVQGALRSFCLREEKKQRRKKTTQTKCQLEEHSLQSFGDTWLYPGFPFLFYLWQRWRPVLQAKSLSSLSCWYLFLTLAEPLSHPRKGIPSWAVQLGRRRRLLNISEYRWQIAHLWSPPTKGHFVSELPITAHHSSTPPCLLSILVHPRLASSPSPPGILPPKYISVSGSKHEAGGVIRNPK